VDTDPDFVVLGEGRNFTLEMVQRSVDMILAGAKFITTNRDPSPNERDGIIWELLQRPP
jgi:NagD protein